MRIFSNKTRFFDPFGIVLLCVLTVWSCAYDNLSLPQEAEEEAASDNPADAIPGQLIIRVSDGLVSEIENATDEEGNVELPEVKSLSADAIPLEITSMERLFPYEGCTNGMSSVTTRP